MNDSAAEFVMARSVAFMDSDESTPFFLMMSMDGLIQSCVASEIPKKAYIIPTGRYHAKLSQFRNASLTDNVD